MNSPSIFFDEDTHTIYVQWRNRSSYHKLNAKGDFEEVSKLPAYAVELNTTDSWQEAFGAGRDEGYDDGYNAGYDFGYEDGLAAGRDGDDW